MINTCNKKVSSHRQQLNYCQARLKTVCSYSIRWILVAICHTGQFQIWGSVESQREHVNRKKSNICKHLHCSHRFKIQQNERNFGHSPGIIRSVLELFFFYLYNYLINNMALTMLLRHVVFWMVGTCGSRCEQSCDDLSIYELAGNLSSRNKVILPGYRLCIFLVSLDLIVNVIF